MSRFAWSLDEITIDKKQEDHSFATDPMGDVESVVGIKSIPSNVPKKIGVYDAWSELKATMVGIPDNDVLPKWYPDWDEPMGNEVSLDPTDTQGKTKREVDPEMFALAVEQLENLCEMLEKEGVKVYRSPLTPLDKAKDNPTGLCAIWAREQFTVFGQKIIRNQTRTPFRWKELEVLDPFFARIARGRDEVGESKLHPIVCTPPPNSGEMQPEWDKDPRVFIEGGDLFHLGNGQVLVTMSHLATSPAGYRWLADTLAPEFEVWPAYLKKDWFHGDYALSIIREGLCMACLDAFVDGILPTPITDWDVIEMTPDEANGLRGSNIIVLRKNVIMTSEPTRRLLRSMEAKGIDVIEVPFDGVSYWQGGLRCATNELLRA